MSRSSHQSSSELLRAAASEFEQVITQVLAEKPAARVLLTGGTLGIDFLRELREIDVPWSRIWMMFSDERFVARNHPDRNEQQGIKVWPELENYLHRFPQPDQELPAAAAALEGELMTQLGPISGLDPVFDLTILGMGPDAHVASLFPDRDRPGGWVVAEPESPKPPTLRLSLSYQALRRSERVWFLAAGISKVWAVKQSLNADSGLPAARVRGSSETRWFLDQEITAEL